VSQTLSGSRQYVPSERVGYFVVIASHCETQIIRGGPSIDDALLARADVLGRTAHITPLLTNESPSVYLGNG
jgi:hypothetical protein